MTNSRILRSSFGGLVALTLTLTACETDETDTTIKQEMEETADERNMEVSGEIIHTQTLDSGVTLDFVDEGDGAVIVIENGPADAPSPLNYFDFAAEATPLEIFLAVADGDVDPPEALTKNHQLIRESEGADALAPRSLSLPDSDGELSFRHATDTFYYSTNCSFAADGQDYFDGWWQSLGWSSHGYWYDTDLSQNSNSSNTLQGYANNTKDVRMHVCNAGPDGQRRMYVFNMSLPNNQRLLYWKYVSIGYRSLFRLYHAASAGTYRLDNLYYTNSGPPNPTASWYGMGQMSR